MVLKVQIDFLNYIKLSGKEVYSIITDAVNIEERVSGIQILDIGKQFNEDKVIVPYYNVRAIKFWDEGGE